MDQSVKEPTKTVIVSTDNHKDFHDIKEYAYDHENIQPPPALSMIDPALSPSSEGYREQVATQIRHAKNTLPQDSWMDVFRSSDGVIRPPYATEMLRNIRTTSRSDEFEAAVNPFDPYEDEEEDDGDEQLDRSDDSTNPSGAIGGHGLSQEPATPSDQKSSGEPKTSTPL